ncbi:MAG TPA: methyltransferase domain-containing protein [Amycolatopsis sp.]|nr:methyltransferase domain-containing protein [Amycolatopsis sp.]
MHAEALGWVARYATGEPVRVLDLGGRDVNGTVRDLFPKADPYVVVDMRPGDGVDIVADAGAWVPELGALYDVVVCTEVFEHAANWPAIVATAHYALAPAGQLILTMAGPGRPAHSAIDGQRLRPGEYYGNVHPETLRAVLQLIGFRDIVVDRQRNPADTRATAVK